MVAMVGLDVIRMGEDIPMDCEGKCAEWDIRNEFETIDGMPVYYVVICVIFCISRILYWAVASAANSCFSQPGCASPGGLYNNRWCGPGKSSYSGARCRTTG